MIAAQGQHSGEIGMLQRVLFYTQIMQHPRLRNPAQPGFGRDQEIEPGTKARLGNDEIMIRPACRQIVAREEYLLNLAAAVTDGVVDVTEDCRIGDAVTPVEGRGQDAKIGVRHGRFFAQAVASARDSSSSTRRSAALDSWRSRWRI